MYVYRIRHKNKPDFPAYYGKTANIQARWAAHRVSGNGLNNSFIARAFGFWGSDAFECHVMAKHKSEFLACCHEERLIWSDFMASVPLYNQSPIGPLSTGRFLLGTVPAAAIKALGIPKKPLRIREWVPWWDRKTDAQIDAVVSKFGPPVEVVSYRRKAKEENK